MLGFLHRSENFFDGTVRMSGDQSSQHLHACMQSCGQLTSRLKAL